MNNLDKILQGVVRGAYTNLDGTLEGGFSSIPFRHTLNSGLIQEPNSIDAYCDHNAVCTGFNDSCDNTKCVSSKNTQCRNFTCLTQPTSTPTKTVFAVNYNQSSGSTG